LCKHKTIVVKIIINNNSLSVQIDTDTIEVLKNNMIILKFINDFEKSSTIEGIYLNFFDYMIEFKQSCFILLYNLFETSRKIYNNAIEEVTIIINSASTYFQL